MTALTTPVLTAVLGVYVVTSLTIPFWVPIVKRITGDSGVFWVNGRSSAPFARLPLLSKPSP